jgi:hypothetical protein
LSPTLGLGRLQFEALITTARLSTNLIRLRPRRASRSAQVADLRSVRHSISDVGEEHGHRVLRVRGKDGKVVLVPLQPAVSRAIDRAVGDWDDGPILRDTLGGRMDRHAAFEDPVSELRCSTG